MPLRLHRKPLMANYWINLRGHNENRVLNDCWDRGKDKKKRFLDESART